MRADRTPSRSSELGGWLFALVLVLPVFIPLAAHYIGFARAGLIPTGFILYDVPYYLANAREITDGGSSLGLYSNAFSFDYESPRIYFQPLTLLLGAALRIPGVDPGVLLAVVGFVAAVVCGRVAIALIDRYSAAAGPAKTLAIVAFFWGGGLVVGTALLYALMGSRPEVGFDVKGWWWFWNAVDPVGGWWFLNFGRNLVLPTEAVYHALFLASVLLILARRFRLAVLAMATLSISHPFTGIQLIAIVGAWSLLEVALLRSKVIPGWFLSAAALLGLFHVGYYLVFLPSFPEHRQLQEQWTLAWTLTLVQIAVAYGLVFAFALWRMRSPHRLRSVVAHAPNRLLLVWLVVCLILENHELFHPKPVQPLHFTRGYSWIALFLLGLPTIIVAFERAIRRRTTLTATVLTLPLLGAFAVDNWVWLSATAARAVGAQLGRGLPADSLHLGFGLTTDEVELYAWLDSKAHGRRVVVSEDDRVGYLTTVYTPLRSWRSHYANTPWSTQRLAELRQFFDSGTVIPEWRTRPTLIVFRDSTGWRYRTRNFGSDPTELVFRNASYTVISVTPAAGERASVHQAIATISADGHSNRCERSTRLRSRLGRSSSCYEYRASRHD